MFRLILFFTLAIAIAAPNALADRRKYVWTYQFATMSELESEIEFYQTTKLSDSDSWEYRIEIEHGLTPRWDLSIYQIFAQNEGESFKWDAFQIRTRYKLAASGVYPLDPLFYLEYNRKIDLKKQNKLEAKLILARDFDRINLALNPVYEFFWAPGDPRHELGIDIGLTYEFSYQFSLGLESLTRHEFAKGIENKTVSYLGPTASVASGSIWYTVGYVWKLTDSGDDARIRFIMGVDL